MVAASCSVTSVGNKTCPRMPLAVLNEEHAAGVHPTLAHPAVVGLGHFRYIRIQQSVSFCFQLAKHNSFPTQQEYKDPESSHIAEEGWRLMVAASGAFEAPGLRRAGAAAERRED